MPPGPPMEGGLLRPPPGGGLTPLAYTRGVGREPFGAHQLPRYVVCIGAGCGHCAAERGEPYRPRRAPIGFGDPPRAEVRLAPVFLAGGVLAALFILLLRSL